MKTNSIAIAVACLLGSTVAAPAASAGSLAVRHEADSKLALRQTGLEGLEGIEDLFEGLLGSLGGGSGSGSSDEEDESLLERLLNLDLDELVELLFDLLFDILGKNKRDLSSINAASKAQAVETIMNAIGTEVTAEQQAKLETTLRNMIIQITHSHAAMQKRAEVVEVAEAAGSAESAESAEQTGFLDIVTNEILKSLGLAPALDPITSLLLGSLGSLSNPTDFIINSILSSLGLGSNGAGLGSLLSGALGSLGGLGSLNALSGLSNLGGLTSGLTSGLGGLTGGLVPTPSPTKPSVPAVPSATRPPGAILPINATAPTGTIRPPTASAAPVNPLAGLLGGLFGKRDTAESAEMMNEAAMAEAQLITVAELISMDLGEVSAALEPMVKFVPELLTASENLKEAIVAFRQAATDASEVQAN